MNSPNWAEQLEAIATAIGALITLSGVIVAFAGVIIAIIYYRKDYSKQQNEINELIDYTKALREKTEFDKQVYKEEILPHFRRLEGGGPSPEQSYYSLKLKNDGESYAFITDLIIPNNQYNLSVRLAHGITKRIEKNSELHIVVEYQENRVPWHEIDTTIELKFTDRTKRNRYVQKIKFKPVELLHVDEVEEIVS